jgi:hypothetical protein
MRLRLNDVKHVNTTYCGNDLGQSQDVGKSGTKVRRLTFQPSWMRVNGL